MSFGGNKLKDLALRFFDSDWFVISIITMIIGFSVIGCLFLCN